MTTDDKKRSTTGAADRPAQKHVGQAGKPGPGSDKLDHTHTPGEGVLQGSTPAGLTAEELRRRAEDTERSGEPGTG